MRSLTAAELWSLLVPKRIDELLYEGPDVPVEVPHTLSRAVSIRRFSHETLPSDLHVLRLTPDRLLYVVVDDESGELIHWNAVLFDTRLPAAFGYDPVVPTIGYGYTVERYRGHRVQPHVLSHILGDLRQSNLAGTAYTLVSPQNMSSIHGIERAGFRLVSRLRAWRFAGLLLRKTETQA